MNSKSLFSLLFFGLMAAVVVTAGCQMVDDDAGYYQHSSSGDTASDESVSSRAETEKRSTGASTGVTSSSKSTSSTSSTRSGSSSAARGSSLAEFAKRDGMEFQSIAYPTGDESTSNIKLQKLVPSEIRAGEAFEYFIEVVNIQNVNLQNVVVSDLPSGNLKITGTQPRAQKKEDGTLLFALGNVEPGGSKLIRINAEASEIGVASGCSSVSYESGICSSFSIVKPQIQLTLSAPAEITVCEDLEVKYRVTNAGSGTAKGVRIQHSLPDNVVNQKGSTSVSATVGDLKPGESREYVAKLTAKERGRYVNQAIATAQGGLKSESEPRTTVVNEAELTLTSKGPATNFLGRPITYEMVVKNIGNAVADDATIESSLPRGAKIVKATSGSRNLGSRVQWSLGSLGPNEARTVTVTLDPSKLGNIRTTATARADCAQAVTSSASTAIKGIPAILLEVIDVEDPVAVGDDETYTIKVTNQGTAAGTGIRIVCELEDTMRFVSAGGATPGGLSGRTVTFQPLASLAPKGNASWKVNVKAVDEGDARFTVKLTSDQMRRSVDETEATNFYK